MPRAAASTGKQAVYSSRQGVIENLGSESLQSPTAGEENIQDTGNNMGCADDPKSQRTIMKGGWGWTGSDENCIAPDNTL